MAKSSKSRSLNQVFKFGVIFFLGILVSYSVQYVTAQVTTQVIHGCVRPNDDLYIVRSNGLCKKNETPLDWNIQGPQGIPGPQGLAGSNSTGLPFFCNGCSLSGYADKFAGKNWSNSQIIGSSFEHANLTGAIFAQGILTVNFNSANLTNADMSNSSASTSTFDDANLTGANFSNTDFSQISMKNATTQNTNFSNSNFTNAVLQGSTGFGTDNLTGIIWSNTTCPDGSNSDNNSNTCVGHF